MQGKLIAIAIVLAVAALTARKWVPPIKAAPYVAYFSAAEKKYQLPPKLLARMALQESGFRSDIINGKTTSNAGAMGLMQIIPAYHR